MVHVPMAITVTVTLLTTHTADVSEAKLTASPEDAAATRRRGGVAKGWLAGAVKVIVCAIGAVTLKL